MYGRRDLLKTMGAGAVGTLFAAGTVGATPAGTDAGTTPTGTQPADSKDKNMWKITPIHVGSVTTIAGGLIMKHGARSNPGELVKVPHIAWLLENPTTGRTVLVDSGADRNDERNSRLHNPVDRSQGKHILEALSRMGKRAEDIDLVIVTHLHWDHAQAIVDLPKKIPVICQREELHFAVDPYPTDAKHYESKATDQLPYFLQFYHQYELVEGEETIEPGIDVVPLPGHSNGSQGVVVRTGQGLFVIAGDLINIRDNWEKRTPGGIYNDIAAYFASFKRLEQLEKQGAVILPAHDFWVFENYPVIKA